jgi:hypothetical protein
MTKGRRFEGGQCNQRHRGVADGSKREACQQHWSGGKSKQQRGGMKMSMKRKLCFFLRKEAGTMPSTIREAALPWFTGEGSKIC